MYLSTITGVSVQEIGGLSLASRLIVLEGITTGHEELRSEVSRIADQVFISQDPDAVAKKLVGVINGSRSSGEGGRTGPISANREVQNTFDKLASRARVNQERVKAISSIESALYPLFHSAPTPRSESIEAEGITIVLYDTSASMSGELRRFQEELISAYATRALHDVSRSGRHRVGFVPFNTEPGTPEFVTNTPGGRGPLDIIYNKLKNTGSIGGGVDIQRALFRGMSLIADAEKRSGGPLATANIVLITDGVQSLINTEDLLQARKAIDRKTPLQTMFISIGASNEKLIDLAINSQDMGVEKGYYREFTAKHVQDILRGLEITSILN